MIKPPSGEQQFVAATSRVRPGGKFREFDL
jgi:hypothetical protein